MDCTKCLYDVACDLNGRMSGNNNPLKYDKECPIFKDKSLYIELPCKVGQTIFFYTCVCDKEGEEKFDTLEGEVISFSIQKEGLWAYCCYKCGLTYWHLVEQDFGKTVFLTQEEAEKALAERSSNEANNN